jgi:hypothetical protein
MVILDRCRVPRESRESSEIQRALMRSPDRSGEATLTDTSTALVFDQDVIETPHPRVRHPSMFGRLERIGLINWRKKAGGKPEPKRMKQIFGAEFTELWQNLLVCLRGYRHHPRDRVPYHWHCENDRRVERREPERAQDRTHPGNVGRHLARSARRPRRHRRLDPRPVRIGPRHASRGTPAEGEMAVDRRRCRRGRSGDRWCLVVGMRRHLLRRLTIRTISIRGPHRGPRFFRLRTSPLAA